MSDDNQSFPKSVLNAIFVLLCAYCGIAAFGACQAVSSFADTRTGDPTQLVTMFAVEQPANDAGNGFGYSVRAINTPTGAIVMYSEWDTRSGFPDSPRERKVSMCFAPGVRAASDGKGGGTFVRQ